MRGPLIVLCLLTLALSWLVFLGAGSQQGDWNTSLLFIGAAALFYWMFRSGQTAPRIPIWQSAVLWAVPAYAALQLITLSPKLLETLSPTRALIQETLGGVMNTGSAPLAVTPPAAMLGLFSLLAFLTVFSLLRDIEWRMAVTTPWMPVIPLLAMAGLEALVGVVQWIGGRQHAAVRGTLLTSEHFASLLEIALPFTLTFGIIALRGHQTRAPRSVLPAISAGLGWFAAALILVALFHTDSPTSHVVVSASVISLLGLGLIPRLNTTRLRLIGAGAAAVVLLALASSAISPFDIEGSMARLSTNNQASAEARVATWNGAANLLADYHWVGIGMGGFESAFPRYQGATDLSRIQHPHSDLLALLITFGVLGALLVGALTVGVLRPAIMGSIFQVDESRRLLAVSISAALVGLVVRSVMEAAISLPATALMAAWVAGMGQSSGLD